MDLVFLGTQSAEISAVTCIKILLQGLRGEEKDALLLPQALSNGRRNSTGHLRSAFLWKVEALRIHYKKQEGWALAEAEALGVRLQYRHIQ